MQTECVFRGRCAIASVWSANPETTLTGTVGQKSRSRSLTGALSDDACCRS